jgi:hypothetical protein
VVRDISNPAPPFRLSSLMAGPRNPARICRVRNLEGAAPGWIAVVVCRTCGDTAALPTTDGAARAGMRRSGGRLFIVNGLDW